MNDLATWHRTNDEYLSAATNWLRLQLIRLSEQQQAPVEATSPTLPAVRKFSFWGHSEEEEYSSPPEEKTIPPVSAEQLDQAATAMNQAAESDPPPP
ncbi:MAG: hypothetical protein R3B95_14725 [Nitrospirales bacterium]|nr:hypothetical protein [Nitrospirales bacterium]